MVLLTTLTYLCTMMLLLPFLYLGAFIMADIGKKIMKTWMYQMAIASILVLLIAIASSGVLMLMADAAPSAPPIAETVGMYHADYFC